jgi:hypothetical protein
MLEGEFGLWVADKSGSIPQSRRDYSWIPAAWEISMTSRLELPKLRLTGS